MKYCLVVNVDLYYVINDMTANSFLELFSKCIFTQVQYNLPKLYIKTKQVCCLWKLMAHNSFSPGLRTPDLAPSRANLPLLSASRANVPFFCTKVTANCDFEDDSDLDIGYYCTEIIPRKAIKQGLKITSMSYYFIPCTYHVLLYRKNE